MDATPSTVPQIEGVPAGLTAVPIGAGQATGVPPGLTPIPIPGNDNSQQNPSGPPPPPGDDSTMGGYLKNQVNDFGVGFGHGVAKTAAGIGHILSKIDPSTGQLARVVAPGVVQNVQTMANEPNANADQSAGEFMEDATEFLLGDEALKGLSFAEKLKKVAPAIKVLQENPTARKALASAMKTGALSGAQTLAKTGGDVKAATESAIGGAAAGGLLTAGAGKLGEAIAARAPQAEQVGNETMVRAQGEPTEGVAKANQAAGQNVISDTAKAAAQQNLTPIVDVPAAVAKVSSFGDAADEVEKAAKKGYDTLNQDTNGEFGVVRDEIRTATSDIRKAVSPDIRDEAQIRLDNATSRMNELFDNSEGKVDRQDWQDANTAWRNAKTLRQVHDAVESTFDTDAGFSQRSGTYRGFNGNMLRAKLNRLTQTVGEPELNRVIGRSNLDNLRKVAELTRTNSDRAKFGGAVQNVSNWIVNHVTSAGVGALAGHALHGLPGGIVGAAGTEAAYMAARKIMQMVATNPKFGQQLTFAVESGARPENYAPLLGQMVRDAEQPNPEN